MNGTAVVNGSETPTPRNREKAESIIVGRGLVKRYGKTEALCGLNITVPQGSVYALLGRNGAGKSTLIQLLMGMLEPTSGSIKIFGLDPIFDDIAVKQRLGYIPERMPMYEWMTVDQILRFVSGMYTNWSSDDEDRLAQKFRLKRDQKISVLSRGNRALLSLVIAMSHQPDLVLLDECTSGMDALARREFERSVIDALSGAGRTVLFAGHQIDEMERICDWVGIMHAGRIVVEMPIDELKQSIVSLRCSTNDVNLALPVGCNVLTTQSAGGESIVTVYNTNKEVNMAEKLSLPGVKEVIALSLEEIFVALMTAEDAR